MGGLAIFVAFAFGVIVFVPMDSTYVGLLLGALMITIMGMFDDIYDLKAWVKLQMCIRDSLLRVRSYWRRRQGKVCR